MSRWMSGLDMEVTPLRRIFLQRYEALLALREVSLDNVGPRQAAMEVLLNLWRHPQRQESYLRAIVSKLRVLINEQLSAGIGAPNPDDWDVPGHVPGNAGFRFCVIADPEPDCDAVPRILHIQ
jgi:hypothetical protein